MTTPALSLTMIVRDEEANLERCLSSVAPYVDEIIIVDTGSQDRTVEIARQFTDRIFHFEWINDFSAARQYALDQATGKWLFWLDADDILIGGEYLRAEIADAANASSDLSDLFALYWRYVSIRTLDGTEQASWWRERCIPNNAAFRWHGRVHEVLTTDQPYQRIQSAQISVQHWQGESLHRSRRNLTILEAEYAESADVITPRSLYYLGNEYRDHGQWEDAVRIYSLYLERGNWAEERYFAGIRLANCLHHLERYHEAITACLLALREQPTFPHAYYQLACYYYHLKD